MEKEYIQLPPLPADLNGEAVKMVWEFAKLTGDVQESVLNDMCEILGEKGKKVNVPKNHRKVANEEITDYVEAVGELMRSIVWEASDIAAWVFVRKIIDKCSVEEMIEELPHAKNFIIIMDTMFEKNLRAVDNHASEDAEE